MSSSSTIDIATHLRRTLALAGPILLTQLAVVALGVADAAMVGHAGTDELAYMGIGRVVMSLTSTVGAALMTGVLIFAAKADGAGRPEDCGAIWRAGIVYAVVLSSVGLAALLLGGEALLAALGLSDDLIREGSEYLRVIAISLPAIMLINCTALFFNGISRPQVVTVLAFVVVPLNILLNWIFIFGHLGAPVLGATGAALGTTISEIVGAVMIVGYALNMKDRDRYAVRGTLNGAWAAGREMRRFGVPLGFATGADAAGFSLLTVFAGYLGIVSVSALEVIMELFFAAFIVIYALAQATSVRVGNAVGREDYQGVKVATWLAMALAAVAMTVYAAVYVSIPGVLAWIFTEDPAVIALVVPALAIAALALLVEPIDYIVLYALRAAGDQWVASAIQISAFLLIMVPFAWYFAFTLGHGFIGLIYAILLGVVCAALALNVRFYFFTRRQK